MSPTVLLTRPESQNDGIKSRFEAAGQPVVVIPMLEIEPIDVGLPDKQVAMDLDRYDHIIFVSGNAVEFGLALLQEYWPQWPVGLKWYAVGVATAMRLTAFGIDAIVPDTHTSEGILALEALSAVDSSKILIVRGVGGRTTLGEALAQRGASVDYLEVYRRRQVMLRAEEKRDLAATGSIVAPVYSGETLEALAANLGPDKTGIYLIVPSTRVAGIASSLGFEAIVTAASAADEDMFACARTVIEQRQ
jgi:uroporphyrinogen-III synthase